MESLEGSLVKQRDTASELVIPSRFGSQGIKKISDNGTGSQYLVHFELSGAE